MRFYQGAQRVQSGKGLGNKLSALYKTVVPALQKAVSTPAVKKVSDVAKKAAIDAGLNIINDLAAGDDIKQSLDKNLGELKVKVGDSLSSRKRKKISTPVKSRKKRRTETDLFG